MNGMNIEGPQKKLREAKFFLDKMIEHERRAVHNKEPFDFYLSAFLNAGRTVDYRLRHEHKAKYAAWRTRWDKALPPTQQRLITFMIDDRDVEVHESGSSRRVGIENREFGLGIHKLASGSSEHIGPPDAPPAIIPTPAYYFTIDGVERKATEACGEYLALLEQMVAAFIAHR